MFRYARALLAKCERTRGVFIEAYVRVRLSHYKDLLEEFIEDNKEFVLRWARRMYNSKKDTYKAYCEVRFRS